MTILAAILLLVIIMDPIGNVPVFLSILKNIPLERRRIIIIRELLIAFIILLFFMFVGRYLLQMLEIEQSSLGVTGGIILFIIAIRMIFPGTKPLFGHNETTEPLVVPLAVPMLAGLQLLQQLYYLWLKSQIDGLNGPLLYLLLA